MLAKFLCRNCLVLMFCAGKLLAAQSGDEDSQRYLDRLEWRGVMVLPGETQFSFHDQSGQKGFWVKFGQVRNGVEVVRYDADEGEVTLRRGDAVRTLVLNDSKVQELEESQAAAPPPLVRVGNQPSAEEEEGGVVSENAGELWTDAIGRSAQLREIDQQFKKINSEEENIREGLAELESDDPNVPHLEERLEGLEKQRRFLTEGAVSELGKVQGVSAGSKNELAESFKGGFSRQLMTERQRQESMEPGEDGESEEPN